MKTLVLMRTISLALLLALPAQAQVVRSEHWTDSPGAGGKRTRQVGNWLNYRLPGGSFQAADPALEADAGVVDEFEEKSIRAPLQVYIGDTASATNTARLGVRLSAQPDHWLQIQAVGVTADVVRVVDRTARTATWADLWTNSTLIFTVGRGRVRKDIVLSAAGHPAAFRFAMRYPAGFAHTINADYSVSFKDAAGVEWLRMPPPFGSDSAGTVIRVSTIAAPDITVPRGTFPSIRIVPNATDLQSAVYPVTVDPTVTLSGTTAIEDTFVTQRNTNNNVGGSTIVRAGWDGNVVWARDHALFRIATNSIPNYEISAFRIKMYYQMNSSQCGAGTTYVYRVKAVNAWVEGTADFAQQNGSACWNAAKLTTLTWAGSAAPNYTEGCSVSGVDYDADASPPSFDHLAPTGGGDNPATDVLLTGTLKVIWATDWRDGLAVNNGIVMKASVETGAANAFSVRSTEATTHQPTFEFDYVGSPLSSTSKMIRPSSGGSTLIR